MQPRLTRSRTEVIIAGVCGGLAEYFVIDPVIVRLIFVLVTLTSGIGLLVYPILWLVMPRTGATASGAQLFPHDANEWKQRAHAFGEEASQVGQQFGNELRAVLRQGQSTASQSRSAAAPSVGIPPPRYADAPPPPDAYNFDPQTGLPIKPPAPTTGRTVNLRIDPTEANLSVPPPVQFQQPQPAPVRQGRRGRMLGFILLGIGVLVLANIFHIEQYVFPLLLIGAGAMLLRKH